MAYLWVIFALTSAFTLATSDALTKKALAHSNEYLVAFFRLVFSLPLLFIIWFFIPVPNLDSQFFSAFAVVLPLEIIAIVLYVKALKLSPLSVTLPFLALTPVFLIIFSYVIVGESVTMQGGFGILLIASGSYLLNIEKIQHGIFEPFKTVTREKGSIFMICVALIFSITSSFGKIAIEHSSALFFVIVYYTALTVSFAPLALWLGKNELSSFIRQKQYKALLVPGIFYSVMAASHMLAMKLTNVAYMISVKRLSLIIGIFYGYVLFREKNLRERLLGGILMFAGFVLIVTAS